MSHQIQGTIKKIFDRQDFPSGFYKQEFVVTTDEQYPQDVKLDCLKEKCDMLAKLNEGDTVSVEFDIRGREWNDRFYVDLSAWKVEQVGNENRREGVQAGAGGVSGDGVDTTPVQPDLDGNDNDDDDDVPF